ncbi:MAG: protein-L-isoaspartate O-methyltransferase [Ignavibacteria bacterium GWB2_35_12]|nr:MAG: protein-L-isoaspartate O-methyltransferase [Ignavibacteria bacterium GWB2_35_12]OGU87403.1 MAG: protein-L-isoaspartate O-methyltransferase [Ignavibacteria bacterium RIFOXYA2_FULL_35_10]OGV22034.1 MAG: protein-L-isoaspartate O-methyltransferase [Ignavibacteria bacterium RIFOXYC2_FULL_35_21]
MLNNYDNAFYERRRLLIESLRRRGNLSEEVLDAMLKLPREKFLDSSFHFRAYEDTALPIDANQTISQPYTVAYMTTLLDVKKGGKVLEIGTGSGYQACILALLGAKVYTIERIPELVEKARKVFKEFGLKINTRVGDGTIGWSEFAPYQGIIVTAAAPDVPDSLMEQLALGGRLVVPVGTKSYQSMYLIERKSEKDYNKSSTDSFKFVPLIGKEGWKTG